MFSSRVSKVISKFSFILRGETDILPTILWGSDLDISLRRNMNGNFLPKMLLWERLKYQDRFKDYRDKVVHIVLDDTAPLDIPQIPGTHFDPSVDGRWKIEHRDTIAGFRAFLAWNQTTKFLTEGDVFISVCPKYTFHIVHTLTFDLKCKFVILCVFRRVHRTKFLREMSSKGSNTAI